MKKICSISLLFILLFTPVLSLRCDSENIETKIEESYIDSDFESSAKLILQKISQFKGNYLPGAEVHYNSI